MQQTAHRHKPLNTEGFAHPHTNVSVFGIEHGMQIADFGSGSGHYVLAMAEHLSGSGHVYAIDVQRDLLKRTQNEATKRGLKNVAVIWADLEAHRSSKIADRHLDIVLISNLLFQVENKEALFIEAHRILKSTGRLVVIDWSESWGGMGPIKSEVVKKETAFAYARDNGFEFLRDFPAGAHHYGLIFKPIHHSHTH